ncbi:MAG TPA: YchJ family metal-binding protein [Pseudomonadales bacterium]|nr:YchJ family metal-binding protein [Pseudomonadales bacterium]
MATIDATAACPCDSGRAYGDCCEPIHAGADARTAADLMRSRYSAFVLENADHLLASWHPDTRPATIEFDLDSRWLGLKIRATAAGGPEDDVGTVEFVARYKIDGRGHRLHELSEFVRHEGRWTYVTGHRKGATAS